MTDALAGRPVVAHVQSRAPARGRIVDADAEALVVAIDDRELSLPRDAVATVPDDPERPVHLRYGALDD